MDCTRPSIWIGLSATARTGTKVAQPRAQTGGGELVGFVPVAASLLLLGHAGAAREQSDPVNSRDHGRVREVEHTFRPLLKVAYSLRRPAEPQQAVWPSHHADDIGATFVDPSRFNEFTSTTGVPK